MHSVLCIKSPTILCVSAIVYHAPHLPPPSQQAVNLAPIPQSLTFSGDGGRILSTWGLNTLNTTAGDWLRLAPSQPQLTVRQPVLLAADVMLSGVVTSADNNGSGSSKPGAGRHLLQQQGGGGKRLALQCDGQAGSAVSIRWVAGYVSASRGSCLSRFNRNKQMQHAVSLLMCGQRPKCTH